MRVQLSRIINATQRANKVPYNGKVWQGECLANSLFSSVWPKGLLIVTTNLDCFSLVNHRRFAKLAKLSHYTVHHRSGLIFKQYYSNTRHCK